MTDSERKRRIAYAIRSAREERGLSRPQLATLVGVGRSAVNDWENAETLPSLLNLGPICDALGVDPDLFAHPPEIPDSPVRRYLLRAVESAVDEALAEQLGDETPAPAPDPSQPPKSRKRGR